MLADKIHATCVALLTGLVILPANAKTLCFDQEFATGTTLKITPLADGDVFHPDKARYYIPQENVSIADIAPLLEQLEPQWETPNSGWPVQSVKIEYRKNYQTLCRVIYSKSFIYSQYDDLTGFVVQGLSERFFGELNKTVMQSTSPLVDETIIETAPASSSESQ